MSDLCRPCAVCGSVVWREGRDFTLITHPPTGQTFFTHSECSLLLAKEILSEHRTGVVVNVPNGILVGKPLRGRFD